ncbi:MAG TPA: 2'-5' RNA ligase family protein [Microlunatus sp.]
MLKLVVISPLTPLRAGDEFDRDRIPLHLTVLPPIRVDEDDAQAVTSAVVELASATAPITVTGTDYADFGPGGDVRVTTVDGSQELRQLHSRLLGSAQQAGAVPVQPDYNGPGYRPHITHTDDGVVRPGERILLSTLAIIDCTGATRPVAATAPLAGSN